MLRIIVLNLLVVIHGTRVSTISGLGTDSHSGIAKTDVLIICQPMHIMLLAPGKSMHSQRFLQMLLDVGNTVTLLDSYNPSPDGAERYAFLPYPQSMGFERFRNFNRLARRSNLVQWLRVAQLSLIWRRVRPDVLHLHWIDQRAYDCYLARLHPLVLTCWGSDINNLFDSTSTLGARMRLGKALSKADYITADSPEVLERCEILSGQGLPKSTFYFGIDFQKFRLGYSEQASAFRQKLGLSSDTKVILSIRRLEPLLGHQYILQAFAKLIAEDNIDSVLVFHRYLSSDSEYENELGRVARELGIADKVIWLDELDYDQMPILYSMADLVINYPVRDGVPVSLFEAAACKKPLIISDIPAYREIVHGTVFTRVHPADVFALALAIKQILATPPYELRRQVELNYRAIAEKADQQVCVAKIDQIYQRLTRHGH